MYSFFQSSVSIPNRPHLTHKVTWCSKMKSTVGQLIYFPLMYFCTNYPVLRCIFNILCHKSNVTNIQTDSRCSDHICVTESMWTLQSNFNCDLNCWRLYCFLWFGVWVLLQFNHLTVEHTVSQFCWGVLCETKLLHVGIYVNHSDICMNNIIIINK